MAPANRYKSSAQLFNYVLNERKFYSEATINYVDARDVAQLVFAVYKKNLGEKFIACAGSIEMKTLMDKIAGRLNKKGPSIKVPLKIIGLIAWLEELRCRLTAREPLISRQSAKMAREVFFYKNKKSVDQLGQHYRSLDETLDWCCPYYRHLQ